MTRLLTYSYQALSNEGAVEKGTLDAPSELAAARALRDRGVHPYEIRVARGVTASRGIPGAQLALGLRALADLTASGMPIARAVSVFQDIAPTAWAAACPAILGELNEGSSFGHALADVCPGTSPTALLIIKAAESSDGLANGLRRAAEGAEEQQAFRSALWGALTYPIVLAAVGAGSVVFLLAVVLPRLTLLIGEAGDQLPPLSRLLFAVNEVAPTHWYLLGAITVTVSLLLAGWTRTAGGRNECHRLLMSAPVIGDLRAATATSRICDAMGAMLESGVPFSAALLHVTTNEPDAEVARRLLAARGRILAGSGIAHAFSAERAVTVTARQLTRVGEENGSMADMLRQAARLERRRVSERVRLLVRLLEPAIILVFGGIVALLAAGLMQAVYSIRPR